MVVFQDPKTMMLPPKQGPRVREAGCVSIGHSPAENSKDWHQHVIPNQYAKPNYASNLKNLFDEYGYLKSSKSRER